LHLQIQMPSTETQQENCIALHSQQQTHLRSSQIKVTSVQNGSQRISNQLLLQHSRLLAEERKETREDS
jgi:hypothetical protein